MRGLGLVLVSFIVFVVTATPLAKADENQTPVVSYEIPVGESTTGTIRLNLDPLQFSEILGLSENETNFSSENYTKDPLEIEIGVTFYDTKRRKIGFAGLWFGPENNGGGVVGVRGTWKILP